MNSSILSIYLSIYLFIYQPELSAYLVPILHVAVRCFYPKHQNGRVRLALVHKVDRVSIAMTGYGTDSDRLTLGK